MARLRAAIRRSIGSMLLFATRRLRRQVSTPRVVGLSASFATLNGVRAMLKRPRHHVVYTTSRLTRHAARALNVCRMELLPG